MRTSGGATEVTWSIEGDMPVPILGGYVVWAGRGAVDATFDRGLARLKQTVEAPPGGAGTLPETQNDSGR